jgi:hypothetical protein
MDKRDIETIMNKIRRKNIEQNTYFVADASANTTEGWSSTVTDSVTNSTSW